MSKQSFSHTEPKYKPITPKNPELELIERIKAGDTNAFGIFVVKYQTRLIQFLYRKYGDNGLIEDVAQNTFILAYNRLSTFKGNSRFYTWLCTIGIRQMINALQYKNRRPDSFYEADSNDKDSLSYIELASDSSENIEQDLILEERRRKLEYVMSQVPEKLLTPLLMSAEQGYSYMEIAEKLNITIGSVRSRINRARNEFKRILSEVEEAEQEEY